ncbi:hypothetical protein [Saccharothrix yanglingensis]|uniref:Uncharacterized protein n=1 Tax=Saccharothrix yanglingensis TaxID=659496 RepID=A0ABU0X394_9PSEU|nr:hypothetical protein [Saccharothrix yanglingensis]MDQ2586476.1 hypothetical protein [Saccharothrix yanglingensis]
MSSFHEPDPREALATIDRAGRRVRRERWWYVAAAAVVAVSTAAFYTGLSAAPDAVADLVLPGALVVVVLTGLIGLRLRAVDRTAARLENAALWAGVGLAVPTMLLIRFVLPEGFTPWSVAAGVLPAVPFGVLAWRVARR